MTRVPPLRRLSAPRRLFFKIKLLSEAEMAKKKTGTLGLIAEAWTATLGRVDNICRDVRRGSWGRNRGGIISANGPTDGGKIHTQS